MCMKFRKFSTSSFARTINREKVLLPQAVKTNCYRDKRNIVNQILRANQNVRKLIQNILGNPNTK